MEELHMRRSGVWSLLSLSVRCLLSSLSCHVRLSLWFWLKLKRIVLEGQVCARGDAVANNHKSWQGLLSHGGVTHRHTD